MILLLGCYIERYRPAEVRINDQENKKLIILQAILGFISAACFIYGIKYLPLSEAITLMYTTPIFTGIFAWYVMNEPWTRNQWVFTAVSMVGVGLIVRPTDVFDPDDGELNINGEEITHSERVKGVLFSLMQSILLSVNMILYTKVMGPNVHPLTNIIFNLVISVLLSPFFVLYLGYTSLSSWDIFYIVLMGVTYTVAIFFLHKSYQYREQIGNLRMLNYLQVIFGYVIDILVIKDQPEAWSVIGTVLIIASNISILYIPNMS
jgi:drug/metabolite transporter (DMT)-like permease